MVQIHLRPFFLARGRVWARDYYTPNRIPIIYFIIHCVLVIDYHRRGFIMWFNDWILLQSSQIVNLIIACTGQPHTL